MTQETYVDNQGEHWRRLGPDEIQETGDMYGFSRFYPERVDQNLIPKPELEGPSVLNGFKAGRYVREGMVINPNWKVYRKLETFIDNSEKLRKILL